MSYSVLAGPTLYRRFIRDDSDLPAIKAALSDFLADGFTIDTDPEESEIFHTRTFPHWCSVGDACDAWMSDLDFSVPRPLESFSTIHKADGTCIAVAVVDYRDNEYSHRYVAVVPEFRDQGLFQKEYRQLGMVFVFDLCRADSLLFERPDTKPKHFRGMEIGDTVDSRKSMGRGTETHYNVNRITRDQWNSFKEDPNSGFNAESFVFEWRN